MIFGPRPTSIGEVWSGMVLVHDILAGLVSVEDINALTKVPGGQQPCGNIGGWYDGW